ncbi:hypothetical protein F66182_2603 [Fusarium sp. NRRL 66182]|nr:hypothetical protein F66182_2603 [Fusarium sp. NRRL 66182]
MSSTEDLALLSVVVLAINLSLNKEQATLLVNYIYLEQPTTTLLPPPAPPLLQANKQRRERVHRLRFTAHPVNNMLKPPAASSLSFPSILFWVSITLSMSAPTKYAVALFPGFQALDVFGPLDTLNFMSKRQPLQLSLLHTSLDPVSTLVEDDTPGIIGQSVVPTHTYDTAPDDIEVLLVPGGVGTEDAENVKRVRDFVKERYPKLRYLLTVCTGSVVAAQAGVLDGKEATSYKRYFDWVVSQGPEVKWVRKARWVVDGNIWTSSGVSAGIDMIYAFIAEQYGQAIADDTADGSEYVRNKNSGEDPFAT